MSTGHIGSTTRQGCSCHLSRHTRFALHHCLSMSRSVSRERACGVVVVVLTAPNCVFNLTIRLALCTKPGRVISTLPKRVGETLYSFAKSARFLPRCCALFDCRGIAVQHVQFSGWLRLCPKTCKYLLATPHVAVGKFSWSSVVVTSATQPQICSQRRHLDMGHVVLHAACHGTSFCKPPADPLRCTCMASPCGMHTQSQSPVPFPISLIKHP